VKRPILAFQDSTPKAFGMFLGVSLSRKGVDPISGGRHGNDGAKSKMCLIRREFFAARFVRDQDGVGMAALGGLPHLSTFQTAEFMTMIVIVHDAYAVNRLDRDTVERATKSFVLAGQVADNGKSHDDKRQPEDHNGFMKTRHDHVRASSTDNITNDAR